MAAVLNELEDPAIELDALEPLVEELLRTHAIDEVEPLVLCYRNVAKAQ